MEKLIRIIIVEDEDDIRNGLAHIINWHDLGYHLAETFSDGESAASYLEGNPVDVVLTDVRLPGISGLELASWINEHRPNIRTLILSGYSDFHYAQTAIDCDVYKYMLKPTEPGEFKRIFIQLRDGLRETGRKVERQQQANQYCLESLLRMMARGDFDAENSAWFSLIALGRNNDAGWIVCKLAHEKTSEGVKTLFYDAFEAHDEYCVVPADLASGLLVLALPRKAGGLLERARVFQSHIDRAINVLRDLTGIRLSVTAFGFDETFANVERLLRDRREPGPRPQAGADGDGEQISDAIECIEEMDMAALRGRLGRYGDEALRNVGFLLLARLNHLARQARCDAPPVAASEYARILSKRDEELAGHIEGLVGRFEQVLAKKPPDIVEKVCAYIDGCHGRGISLTEAAKRVYVSPAYLSRLFSERMGVTLKAYAVKASMKHAMELLERSDMKVYDISGQLGYKDTRHFYSVFYRHTGTTPTQYRKAHRPAAQNRGERQ